MHPFLADLRPTLHISHRGGAALAPENTLAAFEQAVRRFRTDVLELDVRATRDGEMVVVHDATLDRTTDAAGPISGISFADLCRVDAGYRFSSDGGRTFPMRGRGVRVPRLAEVLEAFPDVRVNVELKAEAAAYIPALARALERATARVCVGSEDDGVAAALVDAMPDACHFYPKNALTEAVLALREGRPIGGPYVVLDMPLYFLGARLVDAPLLARAAAAERWVNVWTVDDPDEMRRLVDEGVGGIMTDRPDLLRETLDARLP